MSVNLQGPWPGAVTTTILPNPELDNSEGRDISVDFRRSMNNTGYSYVKSSDRKRISFQWEDLGRGKIVEVQEFFKLYAGSHILLTDFRGDQWDVIFADNPVVTEVTKRSDNSGGARKESGTLSLEFLGTKL